MHLSTLSKCISHLKSQSKLLLKKKWSFGSIKRLKWAFYPEFLNNVSRVFSGKLTKIIVHCGALSLRDAKDLAEHAEQCKADSIACIAPSFTLPPNEEYLVNTHFFMRKLVEFLVLDFLYIFGDF